MQHRIRHTALAIAAVLAVAGCGSTEQLAPGAPGSSDLTAAPFTIVSVVTEPTIGIPGEALRFSLVASGAQPSYYNWAFGDGASSNASDPTHSYDATGTYEATLTAAANSDTSSHTFSVVVEPAWCPEVIELNAVAFARNRTTFPDSDERGRQARALLAENLDLLKTCPSLQVTIRGAATERERQPMGLARERAEAVAQFYVAAGVSPDRLSAQGLPTPVETMRHLGPLTESIVTGSKR